MIIARNCIGQKLLPYLGKAEKHPTLCLYKNLILYHVSNFRTPMPPTIYDWRNLYNLQTEREKEYCWKCKLKTKAMNCPNCGSDKFFLTNK